MPNFDFVSDEKFLLSLEKDYQELTLSLKNGAWKAAHLLAGSMIEAILIDYLVATGYKEKNPLSMSLEDVISICTQENAHSEKTEYIAYSIKSYRNLIHPDKIMRLGESVEESSAKVAQALVEIISKEVSEAKKKVYGYTAEQIINKIIKDSSTNSILHYLLKNTTELEKKRLLLEVLPQKYIEHLEKTEYKVNDTLATISKSFYIIFNATTDQTKKMVVENFVNIIKEEGAYQVFVHQNQFFKGHFLTYLSAEDTKIVKEYLFSTLEEQVDKSILKTMEGIGEFIQIEDVKDFINPIILSTFKKTQHASVSIEDVGEFLSEEYPKMPENVKGAIRSFLNEDKWSFRNDNDKERLTYLRNLIMLPKIWTSR